MSSTLFRCGYFTLIGRPNSGKSTLLNALLGEQLAIISAVPQTTRKNLCGIASTEQYQIIFIDTPGMHQGKYLANKAMTAQAAATLQKHSADCIGLVVDMSRSFGQELNFVVSLVEQSSLPCIVFFNKADICKDTEAVVELFFQTYPQLSGSSYHVLCARQLPAEQKKDLLEAIAHSLPQGPALFDPEQFTDATLRMLAAEKLQESLMKATKKEVPHASCVEIEAYAETAEKHTINAVIYVETTGQKAIVLGERGKTIKMIRHFAARQMKKITGIPTTYEVFIKIEKNWRNNQHFLKEMGLQSS